MSAPGSLAMSATTSPALKLAGGIGPPGFVASKARLEFLREQRRLRRLWNDIESGKWKSVLLDAQRTQHLFRKAERHGGLIAEMIVKVNLVKPAFTLHADVVANRPITTSTPEGHEEQQAAIASLRERCLWDGLFHQAALRTQIESEAALRVDRCATGEAVIVLDTNDECLPVGEPDPCAGGQPSVWERRWIIERPNPNNRNKPLRFLRVERHRADGGVGAIEQEAYRTESDDTIQDLSELERVPLATAIADAGAVPEERTPTGMATPLVTQLVIYRVDGQPRFRVSEHDLDILDQTMASVSQIARTLEKHFDPKLRINESMIDAKTGEVKAWDTVIDPDKLVEYIQLTAQFEFMLKFIDRALDWLMVALEINAGLVGLEGAGGSPADTAAKLRLRSVKTIAAAQRARPYMQSALKRVFEQASLMDARRPTTGYAVAPVAVRIHPELPKDFADRVEEQNSALLAGVTSQRRAIAETHGVSLDEADTILAEIDGEKDAAAKRAAVGLSASLPTLAGGDPEDQNPAGGGSPGSTGDDE